MYFFRSVEDGNPLTPFSLPHIILLIVFFFGCYLAVRGQELVFQRNRGRFFAVLLAIVLLMDQIMLYGWQFFSGYFNLEISLPFYHCRFAVWLLIFGVLARKDRPLILGMFWGIIGSVSAMFVPDLYHFKFPHYTNFNFFIVHISMGWLILHLLFNLKIKISRKNVREALILTNLFNLFSLLLNLLLQRNYPAVNYAYMSKMPPFIPLQTSLLLHVIIVTVFFNVLVGSIGLLFHQISHKQNMEVAFC